MPSSGRLHHRARRLRLRIAGNVPSALPAVGTADQVERYVAGLLDECATDGGFVLRNGAVLDVAKAENLKAMIDTGRNWWG
jgi:hypothetical protein